MRTIVHIGMSKTGSTVLQGRLRTSSAYLAQRGLLYPKPPPDSGSRTHRLLLALIAPFEDLPRRMKGGPLTKGNIDAKLAKFLRHIRRQIERQKPDGLILSTEGLFVPLPEARRATFRESLRALGGDLRFVAYLRRPSEHYLSILQQRLKASAIVRPPRPKACREVLESYDAAFGEAAVSARLFHRDHLEKGDIVADFCRHSLPGFEVDPAKLSAAPRANETLSAESMGLLQHYRQAFHAERNNVFTEDTKALLAALAEADRHHGARRPRLRPGLAEAIDHANRDCLWIRDRFGVVFPDLDYRRLEAGGPAAGPAAARSFALEELIVIDRELQAQILESLARSPWATADAARQTWLGAALGPPSRRAGGAP